MDSTNATPLAPRAATEQELKELHDFFVRTAGDPPHLDGACVAVFEQYITDCPGYTGKVMVVVWPSGPEYHETFVWIDGELRYAEES